MKILSVVFLLLSFTAVATEVSSHSGRSPAQVVSTPRYSWEADSVKVSVLGNSAAKYDLTVKYSQYATYQFKQKVYKTVSQIETQWVLVQKPVLVCDEQPGTGQSELWNAFYAAPASKKVSALAAAIQGVGEVSATNLIKNNYFYRKPRNWADFQEEIQRAGNSGVITKSVEHQILYRYRTENMAKLGYNTQTSGYCRLEIQNYYEPKEVVVQKTILVEEVVTRRDLISSELRQYVLSISGQKLQSFESEDLIFNFDRDSNKVSLSKTAFNNYTINFDGRNISVKAISRKAVNLPSDIFLSDATMTSRNGGGYFTADVNPRYIPQASKDGQLLLNVEIYSCKSGMFGMCSLRSRDEKVESSTIKVASSSNFRVSVPFSIAPKRKYWAKYSINVIASPWYNSAKVAGRRSPEL